MIKREESVEIMYLISNVCNLNFDLNACQMTPTVLEGGSGRRVKCEQWLVSEVTERIGELLETCKERRNSLKVGW